MGAREWACPEKVDILLKERQVSLMTSKRRRFSPEFKAEVIQLVLSGRKTVPEICKDHDLYDSSVYNWVRQAKVDSGRGAAGAMTTSEKEEIKRLRRENRELKRERDFLVDAATYFAKAKK